MATEDTKDSNITHGVQDVMKNINFISLNFYDDCFKTHCG